MAATRSHVFLCLGTILMLQGDGHKENKNIFLAYYMPGTVLRVLHTSTHLVQLYADTGTIFFFFFNFWLHWFFVAAHRLSLVAVSGGYSLLWCGGFYCCGAQALGAQTSVVVACGLRSCGSQALERRLSSCGTRAQLLCGMWDPPRPGIELTSPALAGRFSTTAPPGKSPIIIIIF